MRIGTRPVSSGAIIAGLGYTPVNKAGDTLTGRYFYPNGTAALPTIAATSVPTNGLWFGANFVGYANGGVDSFAVRFGSPTMGSLDMIQWTNGSNNASGGSVDTGIMRHAANWVGVALGATAVALSVFKARTDVSNYQSIQIEPNLGRVITNWAGTGAAFDLDLGAGASQWRMKAATGHLIAVTDNTQDIGQSGANRPRHYFGGGDITANGTVSAGNIFTGTAYRVTPQTAPGNPSSGWYLYTDSGDANKLKAKASNGTVVTLGTP